MAITTYVTSREFNQNSGKAKKSAKDGPVFITERGSPSYVLLTIEAYKRLAGKELSIAEALAQHDGDGDFDFDPPRMSGDWSLKIPDFED